MKYLLDVNALIAYGITDHTFHVRVSLWAKSLAKDISEFATSSITELGFVRIISQVPGYGVNLDKGRDLIARLKETSPVRFSFIADNNDISKLPAWVKSAKQTTDGHLVQLAKSNNAILATLDENIPGSYVIPDRS